jgi:hypothetical protein
VIAYAFRPVRRTSQAPFVGRAFIGSAAVQLAEFAPPILGLTSFRFGLDCSIAAEYPAPKQGEWTARDFVFHTGVPIRLAEAEVSEPIHRPDIAVRPNDGEEDRVHALVVA